MSPHGRSLRVAPEALQAAARETLRLRPGRAGSAALAWIENPAIAYFTPDRPEHSRLCDLSSQ